MRTYQYSLSPRSMSRLTGVHEDLKKIVLRAIQITDTDFGITEGLRSKERQRKLLSAGATKTLNSRHLTGHAVDLVAYLDGSVSWDWPLYYKLADAMKAAAKELRIPIEWGGDWKSFKDGPHFQLPWKEYPV